MNPFYDLVVIGFVVIMVLVNLYSWGEVFGKPTSFFQELRQKLTSFVTDTPKAIGSQHATANSPLK